MYDQFMRHTTNRLRADLTSELKEYTAGKERLVHQLNNLHTHGVRDLRKEVQDVTGHADLTTFPTTHTLLEHPDHGDYTSTSSDLGTCSVDLNSPLSSPRKSTFYRAPNLAASTSVASVHSDREPYLNLSHGLEKKRRDKREGIEKLKKESELFKLPVIKSASSKRSTEWESGKFLNPKQSTFSSIEPLPGITAAKELLSDTMKIPSIHDPNRQDTAFDTSKNKKALKKVTFADDHHGLLLSINQIEPNETHGKKSYDSKNLEGKGPVPKLNLAANQFSHTTKPQRPKKTSLLPPLEISQKEVHENPQKVTEGVNCWKDIYSTILDPEDKTKALTEIMYAVRMKKFENEQAIKYGDTPRPAMDSEEMVKELMNMNSVGRISYRDEWGNPKASIPTPRGCGRVSQLSTGRPNSLQLQNYLRQMSRSKRVLDRITGQHYSAGRENLSNTTVTPVEVNA